MSRFLFGSSPWLDLRRCLTHWNKEVISRCRKMKMRILGVMGIIEILNSWRCLRILRTRASRDTYKFVAGIWEGVMFGLNRFLRLNYRTFVCGGVLERTCLGIFGLGFLLIVKSGRNVSSPSNFAEFSNVCQWRYKRGSRLVWLAPKHYMNHKRGQACPHTTVSMWNAHHPYS